MKIQWWGNPVMRDPVTCFPGACSVCTEVVLCFSERKQGERASQLASDRRGSCVWLLNCPFSRCQQGSMKLNMRYAGNKDRVYTTYKEQYSYTIQTNWNAVLKTWRIKTSHCWDHCFDHCCAFKKKRFYTSHNEVSSVYIGITVSACPCLCVWAFCGRYLWNSIIISQSVVKKMGCCLQGQSYSGDSYNQHVTVATTSFELQ